MYVYIFMLYWDFNKLIVNKFKNKKLANSLWRRNLYCTFAILHYYSTKYFTQQHSILIAYFSVLRIQNAHKMCPWLEFTQGLWWKCEIHVITTLQKSERITTLQKSFYHLWFNACDWGKSTRQAVIRIITMKLCEVKKQTVSAWDWTRDLECVRLTW